MIATIDFETEAIQPRPLYPPKPVGVAIKYDGKPSRYWAFGHPTKNNCTQAQAKAALKKAYQAELILGHNLKFDLDVAEAHFGLKLPKWQKIHDTLLILFLHDPHAASLSLKPASAELLKMPPDEQDAVGDWLRANGVITAAQNPGAYISRAPGDLVGRYAIGDVDRTYKLFKLLHPKLDTKMREAYDRERKLLPILLKNEREGIRVDMVQLAQDEKKYRQAMAVCEAWIRAKLKNKTLNLDADKDVGDALAKADAVKEWVWTKGGKGRAPQRSVAKANMGVERFRDKKLHAVLDYRNRLQTQLSMSISPWLEQARQTGGRIYTEWNQVRQSHGENGTKGARTGRLSCSRFMNITKGFKDHVHPTWIKGLPPLPLVRKYILPERDHVILHRDFSQQEYKILAHFEDGDLKQAYLKNPRLDQHDRMRDSLTALGYLKEYNPKEQRDVAKMVNLAILYALGADSLAQKLKMTKEDAVAIRAATKKAMPGVAALEQEVKQRAYKGEPVRTWGGRLIYCKPPSVAKTGGRKGQLVTYEYTLLNHLIQGSAADCTKEALVRLDKRLPKGCRLLVTVHDEINVSAPAHMADEVDEIMRDVMEGIEFDVCMVTDPKRGLNWGELKKPEAA